jgi:alkanesulfonate monooxygenase SsuD/methylene tetrahydromethanopterin reductase-like flavin-dependent oxidoreductase (luciferase family)
VTIRVGITLPQFRDDATEAVESAQRAEALGIDGVFCFDHLWPMGQPGRPALSMAPFLGLLAEATSTIRLGSLVARIGLLPDDVLVNVMVSVQQLSGGRMIAGLGTGDHLSRAENDAYGLEFEPADDRRTHLREVAEKVAAAGLEVWIGGGGPKTVAVATAVPGAAVNLWEPSGEHLADLVGQGLTVTWGGRIGQSQAEMADTLLRLESSGVSWAVAAWPEDLDALAAARQEVLAAS